MDRREFLSAFAAAVAAVAAPALVGAGITPRPEIGAEFHVGDWINPNATEDEWRSAGRGRGIAMRRAEKYHGIRFSGYRHSATWDAEIAAWAVNTEATVIGYA